MAPEFLREVVKLNVGGHLFTTTKDTLQSDSDWMIAKMLEGYFEVQYDSDGYIFIDRDGYHFRYILNYLRDDSEVTLPESEQERKELLAEADFYQIEGLIHLIRYGRKLNHRPKDEYGTCSSVEHDPFWEGMDGCAADWSIFPNLKNNWKIIRGPRLEHAVEYQFRIDHMDPNDSNRWGMMIGVISQDHPLDESVWIGSKSTGWGYIAKNGFDTMGSSFGASYSDGDVISMYADLQSMQLIFERNHIVQGVIPIETDHDLVVAAAASSNDYCLTTISELPIPHLGSRGQLKGNDGKGNGSGNNNNSNNNSNNNHGNGNMKGKSP